MLHQPAKKVSGDFIAVIGLVVASLVYPHGHHRVVSEGPAKAGFGVPKLVGAAVNTDEHGVGPGTFRVRENGEWTQAVTDAFDYTPSANPGLAAIGFAVAEAHHRCAS